MDIRIFRGVVSSVFLFSYLVYNIDVLFFCYNNNNKIIIIFEKKGSFLINKSSC